MGSGIAIAFAQAGIPVVVIDTNEAAVEQGATDGHGHVHVSGAEGPPDARRGLEARAVDRALPTTGTSSPTPTSSSRRSSRISTSRREVFAQARRDRQARRRFSPATPRRSTSTRWPRRPSGPNKCSACTSSCRPTSCRCSRSCAARQRRAQTIATAFELGKALRKKAVLSGNAFGFIGNRMIFDYAREATALAEEGVAPGAHRRRDESLRLSDGTVCDERSLRPRRRSGTCKSGQGTAGQGRTNVLERLVEMNRLGQKTMAGFFRYDKSVGKGREPIADPEVEALFAEEARKAGIAPREVTDDEIRERLLCALINRGDVSARRGRGVAAGRHRHRLRLRLRLSAASRRPDVVCRRGRREASVRAHPRLRSDLWAAMETVAAAGPRRRQRQLTGAGACVRR